MLSQDYFNYAMKHFCFSLFILASFLCSGQSQLHVMLSKAPLPRWVNMTPSACLHQVVTQKKNIGWQFNNNTVSILQDAVNAQYGLLASGHLLFNDEAGKLANAVADKLLANDTAFRNTLNIYVSYSNSTDAIAYPSGLIVLELGLFAQLENEDQLAFVISHEIAHIKNGDLTTSELPWTADDWSLEIEEYMKYRRYREIEADILAYELYEKAGYGAQQVLRLFEVLERNWIVPTALSFDLSLFADSTFSYPQYLYPDYDSTSAGYSENDFLESNQEVYWIRRSKLAAYFKLDSTISEVRKPDTGFEIVNRLAIYNCGLIALQNQQFGCALYCGYYLRKKYPEMWEETDLLIGKCLYLSAAFRSDLGEDNQTKEYEQIKKPEKFDNLFFWVNNEEDPADVRGSVLGASIFLESLTDVEAYILSVRWWWDYRQKTHAHYELANLIAGHSILMFDRAWELDADSLSSIAITSYKFKPRTGDDDEDDIKIPRVPSEFKADISEELKRKFDSIANAREVVIKRRTVIPTTKYNSTQLQTASKDTSFILFYKSNSKSFRTEALERKAHPSTLSADSVYFVGSHHVWTNEIKRTYNFRVNGAKSETKTEQRERMLRSTAKSAKFGLISGTSSLQDSLTLEDYNNFSLAMRVFRESAEYGTQAFLYPLTYREEMDSVINTNHVTHALVDIAVTKQFKKVRQPVLFTIGLLIPYSAPFVLIYLVPSRKFTFQQTAVYNLQTGNLDYVWVQTGRGAAGTTQSGVFWGKVFKTIRKKKDKPAAQQK